jgi:hypothetical protein
VNNACDKFMCYYCSFNGFVVAILLAQEVAMQDSSIYVSACVIYTYPVNWQISVFIEAPPVQHLCFRYLGYGVINLLLRGSYGKSGFCSKLKVRRGR